MDLSAVLLIIVAVAIGVAIGWVLGGQPVADIRRRHNATEAELKELRERFARMTGELATMCERAERAASRRAGGPR